MNTRERPLGQVLYASESLMIGLFDCPRHHSLFHNSGPCRGDLLVFPRHAVEIRHPGKDSILANQQVVTLYNRGQEYQREAIADYGDVSVWFYFQREALLNAMTSAGYSHQHMEKNPYRENFASCCQQTFLQQRLLFNYLRSTSTPEPIFTEETSWDLLRQVLTRPQLTHRDASTTPRAKTLRRHVELVRHARYRLTQNHQENINLDELSQCIGATPFHLCRLFRKHTGLTIHQYQTQLRLRGGVDILLDHPKQRLTKLAMDLGFATPSHFSQSFKCHYGLTPGAFINKANRTHPAQISKNMTAHGATAS